MIQAQLKLRLNNVQEARLVGWLWNLTSVWNWAIRKIELDAKDKIYYTPRDFQNLLANQGVIKSASQFTQPSVHSSSNLPNLGSLAPRAERASC